MAVDKPFPRGTFKLDPGPGEREVSVIFKPRQSTIVFSRTRPGELAQEYRVQHIRPGGFGRFSETEVVEEARKLALSFVEKVGPR
jgi:hypothetical protein